MISSISDVCEVSRLHIVRHAANPNSSSEFGPNGSGSGSGSGVIHRTQAESRIWGTLQTFIEIYNRLWTHPNVRSGSGSGSGSVFLNIVSFLF